MVHFVTNFNGTSVVLNYFSLDITFNKADRHTFDLYEMMDSSRFINIFKC
jgi:hypothetical protein